MVNFEDLHQTYSCTTGLSEPKTKKGLVIQSSCQLKITMQLLCWFAKYYIMQIMDHPHSPHNDDTHIVLTSLLDTTSTQLNQILYDLTIK